MLPIPHQVREVVRHLKVTEALREAPEEHVGHNHQTECAADERDANRPRNCSPGGVTPLRDDGCTVVQPIQIDVFVPRCMQRIMVFLELVLDSPAHPCPKHHGRHDSEGEHQVACPRPRLAVFALQVKRPCERERDETQDDRASAQLALQQRDLQHTREHGGRPVGPAAQDHALAEGEPRLPQHRLDGPDEGAMDPDGAPHFVAIAEVPPDDLLLHRTRRKLQEEAERDADDAARPEAPRTAVRYHEATEQVDRWARDRGKQEEHHACHECAD
mmetsp:Transcript_50685/g.130907  ORF Transcript_50685/g.130907 Transcript_50685/m.130907 type:complete len:273 (-) Transcript_50685:47-865(-)